MFILLRLLCGTIALFNDFYICLLYTSDAADEL